MEIGTFEVAWFCATLVVSALAVFLWIKRNRTVIGRDVNKPGHPPVTEGTGIVLLLPLWFGLLSWFAFRGFSLDFLAFGLLVSGFAVLGFLDDTKDKWTKKTFSWRARAALVAVISLAFALAQVPLVWAVPVALYIAVLASFQNTFAGLNGWTGGSGLIVAIAGVALVGAFASSALLVLLCACILGFLAFNRYPARCLEGDAGTFFMGAALAGAFVLTREPWVWGASLLFYVPHFVDIALLKALTNREDASQVRFRPYRLTEGGRLGIPKYPDGRVRYDFAKLVMRVLGPRREWQIVLVIWTAVALNAALWLGLLGFL